MRTRTLLLTLLLAAFLTPALSLAKGSPQCVSCHDSAPDSAVHTLLVSRHGDLENGCESCHGVSEDHQSRPTIASPDINYGPRWSSTVAQQDSTCLDCHKDDDTGKHWQGAVHMSNNFACISCHESHTDKDPVLQAKGQAEVCTVCHKPQKDGIHAMHDALDDNPDCTSCHNPHADQSPIATTLMNRSEGCRACHDLVAMNEDSTVTAKAKSYHRVMVQVDHSCLDCHQSISHGDPGAVEPLVPVATASRDVTLFFPGQSDVDWILSEHPGSQPFRQGSNCQQCHRGEEIAMGADLGSNSPTARVVNVSFKAGQDHMQLKLSWEGLANDADIAFMWSDGTNSAFRRGGCWAACHSDMPGMSRDRGRDLDKYLSDSRSQQQKIGQAPVNKSALELAAMMKEGNFVELWRIDLQEGGKANVAVLQAGLDWVDNSGIAASAAFSNGRWSVTISRPNSPGAPFKSFVPDQLYTFGMALHGADRKGAEHWVSLPMTFSLDGENADFLAD